MVTTRYHSYDRCGSGGDVELSSTVSIDATPRGRASGKSLLVRCTSDLLSDMQGTLLGSDSAYDIE